MATKIPYSLIAGPITVLDFAHLVSGGDWGPAFQAAHDAAVADGSRYFEVPGWGRSYTISTAVMFSPLGMRMVGLGWPTVVCNVAGLKAITMRSFAHVEGINFDSTATSLLNQNILYIGFVDTVTDAHCEVLKCKFTMHSGAGVYSDQGVFDCWVHECEFHLGSAGIFLIGNLQARIENNKFLDVPRSIHAYGGHGNVITGNTINGGLLGISFLSFRAQGAVKNIAHSNVIANNHVFQTVEEGISLDSRGNDGVNWPENGTNPFVTVSSLTTPSPAGAGKIRITVTQTGQAADWANGFMLVGLNGNAVGQPLYIEDSADGWIDVARSNGDPPLQAGDSLVVTTGYFGNVIANNTLHNCVTRTDGSGQGAITMWGSCWGNIVRNNTIYQAQNHGILLNSLIASSGSPWPAHAWSGFNQVCDNIVLSLYQLGSDASAMGYPIYVYSSSADYGTPATPAGVRHTCFNRIAGNHILVGKTCYFADCDGCVVEDNHIVYAGGIEFHNCKNMVFGKNWKIGTRLQAPTVSGTGTGLINLLGATFADLGGAPSQANFNALLANLRAAQVIAT